MSSSSDGATPADTTWDIDLWCDKWGVDPWAQAAEGGSKACSAYAVGAAAYVLERRMRPDIDPGTPDFAFHYNNEAWITSDVRKQFLAAEAKAQVSVDVQDNAFWIHDSARAVAEFGMRFVASPSDALPFTPSVAPPYQAFVQARQHRYSYRNLLSVPRVDPNNPSVSPAPVVARPRHEVVCDALRNKTPVLMGIGIFPNTSLDALPPTPPTTDSTDSHVILIVGFNDSTQQFRFRNSAGTSFGKGGYGTVPYAWVDDADAMFGFFVLEPLDGRLRPVVTLDSLTLACRGRTATITVDAYDGTRTYLGRMSASPADATVVLNPVRWVGVYRLHVTVTPADQTPPTAFEVLVADANGAVASGAVVTLPPDVTSMPDVAFLDAAGTRMITVCRQVAPVAKP